MAARPHDTTRAEMALIRNAKKRHGKAKNGAYGRSCGIARLGTDHQGNGEAAMGRESKRIEKLLNGKAKPRVEPNGYGIDQRRAAELRKSWACRGHAGIGSGYATSRLIRDATEKLRKATHEPKRNGRARRRTVTHGKEAKRKGKARNGTSGIDMATQRWDTTRHDRLRQRWESGAMTRQGAALICFETASNRDELRVGAAQRQGKQTIPDDTAKRGNAGHRAQPIDKQRYRSEGRSDDASPRAMTRHRAPSRANTQRRDDH